MSNPQIDEPSLLNTTTIAALTSLTTIIATAYFASLRLLPHQTTTKLRTFYVWHLADALVHLILEASFLYNCFFTYVPLSPTSQSSDYPHPASLSPTTIPGYGPFLGHADRLYGSNYGNNAFANLWQEYAKADKRWGGADLTIISLELLTVCIGGPLAFYVSELIRRGGGGKGGGKQSARLWFWGSVLAVGELYGGFLTFSPEWLSGSENLDTGSFMKKWVYLVLFNMVWVFLPLWFLYEAYANIKTAFVGTGSATKGKKRT